MARSARSSATRSATASTTRAQVRRRRHPARAGGPTRTARTSTRAPRRWRAQYDTYEPLPGLHINGKLTLGENIADLAGLVIALQGLSHLARRQARAGARRLHRRPALLPRLSRRVWRGKYRDGRCARRCCPTRTARRIPRERRRCATIDAWYAAFDVKPGDKILPAAGPARAAVVSASASSRVRGATPARCFSARVLRCLLALRLSRRGARDRQRLARPVRQFLRIVVEPVRQREPVS